MRIVDASNTYLSLVDASNTYLSIVDASNTYLSIVDASNTYLRIVDASNTYLEIIDASNTYLSLVDASTTYLSLIDASNTYLSLIDASNTYLEIIDASNTYLRIIDASNTYLQLIDASTNYLSRIGNPTSIATSTTFDGKIVVQGVTFSADVGNNKLAISNSIPNASSVGSGTVAVGSNLYNFSATNSVIIGSSSNGSANSVTIGYTAGATNNTNTFTDNVTIGKGAKTNANNCVTVGQGATSSANNCVTIGAGAITDVSQCVAIGYLSHATIPNQIIFGTSGETIYYPGNPGGGATPNTCLVLSSNVTLNTLLNTPPTIGQLGYTRPFTLSLPTSISSTVSPPPTTYADISLNVGTWLITGVVTVESDTTDNSSVFTISTKTNNTTIHNTKKLIVHQTFIFPYLTTSFNYSNIIYNTTNFQSHYILISVENTPAITISTLPTHAYMNATRIA